MASFKELMKDKNERQAILILVSVCLALVGIAVIAIIPQVQAFFLRLLTGGKGLLYLLGAGILLTGWFLLLGVRGKALRYALLILVFTLLCLWLAINLDLVWDSMVHTIGLWPTIIIVLLGAIGVWLIIWMFL
ncbi:MAG: hypothetical protein II026_00355 [Bacteroidales bacterium]|nr:hypothetical protein [Bacteroidales bacterium]